MCLSFLFASLPNTYSSSETPIKCHFLQEAHSHYCDLDVQEANSHKCDLDPNLIRSGRLVFLPSLISYIQFSIIK